MTPTVRAVRLVDMRDWLAPRRTPVTASEIAERYGVTVRTVYRDVLALEQLGLSLQGEAGIGYVVLRASGGPAR